jgi:hypothetical protein
MLLAGHLARATGEPAAPVCLDIVGGVANWGGVADRGRMPDLAAALTAR